MKVLWITNIPFAHHQTMMGMDNKVVGGSWLNAAYDSIREDNEIELHIVTSATVSQTLTSKVDNVTFYIIPGGGARSIDIQSNTNLNYLCKIKQAVEPDVLVLWGTESHLAYLAMKAMRGVPMLIYMQGVIRSIYEHYYDGIPDKYKLSTIRDWVDKFNTKSDINEFRRQTFIEEEMLKMAQGVIVENDWCEDVCRSVNPDLIVFRNYLPIREVFFNKQWDFINVERYSIFTNAGGYPIKGHHILFQALGLVKKRFPDLKCYIPGESLQTFNSIKRRNGYTKMLEDLIREGNLQDNIIYTGFISSDEMVDRLSKCHIYVMPSVMENHSSSLIESLVVGTPSISSLVGGTASLVNHGRNAFLYNSTDYESLAGNIIRIFENDELAKNLSRNALEIRTSRKANFGLEMKKIYTSFVSA